MLILSSESRKTPFQKIQKTQKTQKLQQPAPISAHPLQPICFPHFPDLFPAASSTISYAAFESFCISSQGVVPREVRDSSTSEDDVNGSSIREIFSAFTGSSSSMSLPQFLCFLCSPKYNPLFSPSASGQNLDTSLPFSQYYISSSHNTYLVGSQVLGTSSTLYYRNVLLKNCRCLEIDIWDHSSVNKPVVSHGPTLTTPVELLDVLRTIKKYSFVTTDLPLILSIEIHCCDSYQHQVRDLLIQELGESLMFSQIDANENEVAGFDDQLPLCHFLNKILIKMKRPALLAISSASSSSSLSLLASSSADAAHFYRQQDNLSPPLIESLLEDEEDGFKFFPAANKLFNLTSNYTSDDRASLSSSSSMHSTTRTHSYTSTITSTSTLNSFEEYSNGHQQHTLSSAALSNSSSPSPTKFHIIPELYELSNYIYGLKFHSFDEIPSLGSNIDAAHFTSRINNHCFSFSNKRFKSIIPKSKYQIHKHNKAHLMRIYPAGYKFTSKNFNPVPFWKFGCQMVATNWQTYDIDQQINEAMFINGFVKKPEYLLSNSNNGNNKYSRNSFIDKQYFENVEFKFRILALFNDNSTEENKNNSFFDSNTSSDSTGGNYNVSLQIIDKESMIFATELQNASTAITTISKVFKKKNPIFKTATPLITSNKDKPDENLCVVYNSNIRARIEKTLKDFIFLKISVNKNLSMVVRLIYLNKGYRVLSLKNDRTGESTNFKLLIHSDY